MQLKKAKADFLSRIVDRVVDDEPDQSHATTSLADIDHRRESNWPSQCSYSSLSQEITSLSNVMCNSSLSQETMPLVSQTPWATGLV